MKKFLIAAVFAGFGATAAFAQQPPAPGQDMPAPSQQPSPEQMEAAYNAARNQLGILKYCEAQGHVDGEAAEIQTRMLGLVPPPADPAAGDAAEEAGTQGKVSSMGAEQEFSASAAAQGVDEAQLCEALANSVKQAGANLPQ